MHNLLTKEDLRSFLDACVAAIELDQIVADTLPADQFHFAYRDSTWRNWRREHLSYLQQLLASLNSIAPPDLERLTWTALHHTPEVVREVALEAFSAAVLEGVNSDEPATAKSFFDQLMMRVAHIPARPFFGEDAATRMMRWLHVRDPLRIAQDPECDYGEPAFLLN